MALSVVYGLMIREFVSVLIQITLETSLLIFIAKQLFGFYMVQDIIEGNF